MKKAALILCLLLTLVLVYACSSNGHAPGYGTTSKCTICNKPATHRSTNYGFCDRHWQDAMNYGR